MKSHVFLKFIAICKVNIGIVFLTFISVILLFLSYILNELKCIWISNALLNIACGLIGGLVCGWLLSYKAKSIEKQQHYYSDFVNVFHTVDKHMLIAYNKINSYLNKNEIESAIPWIMYMFEKFEYYDVNLKNDELDGIKNPYKIKYIKPLFETFFADKDFILKNLDEIKKVHSEEQLLLYARSVSDEYYNLHCNIRMLVTSKELQEMDIQKNHVHFSKI